MLKYPCLILDHDDTVVQSEATVNYPYFCYILDQFRPGATITLDEYVYGCFHTGFTEMCRRNYGFTETELMQEYEGWKNYIKDHIPAPFPGMEDLIRKQKALGGKICVVSHSSEENIRRDYKIHFGIQPDLVFGWDYPEGKRKPSVWPLQQILKAYHLTNQEILIVDDMKPAWEMAKKINAPIAYAGWSRNPASEISKEMKSICDFSFFSPEELCNFLFDY